MEQLHGALVDAFERRRGHLAQLARDLAAEQPAAAADVDWDQVDQIMRGFETVILEALRDGTDTSRQLLLETAVPALVQGGATAAALAGSSTRFGVLLTDVLVDLPEELAAEGRRWLAAFFDGYVQDVVRAAAAAGGPV